MELHQEEFDLSSSELLSCNLSCATKEATATQIIPLCFSHKLLQMTAGSQWYPSEQAATASAGFFLHGLQTKMKMLQLVLLQLYSRCTIINVSIMRGAGGGSIEILQTLCLSGSFGAETNTGTSAASQAPNGWMTTLLMNALIICVDVWLWWGCWGLYDSLLVLQPNRRPHSFKHHSVQLQRHIFKTHAGSCTPPTHTHTLPPLYLHRD